MVLPPDSGDHNSANRHTGDSKVWECGNAESSGSRLHIGAISNSIQIFNSLQRLYQAGEALIGILIPA